MFQVTYGTAQKAKSLDPISFNYILLKSVAKVEYMSSILNILVSLPFVYEFANNK